jgi:hypothetical protein
MNLPPVNVRFSLRTSRDALRDANELLRRLRSVIISYNEYQPRAFIFSTESLVEEFEETMNASLICVSNLLATVNQMEDHEERRKRNE